ncbi:MAG: hypothetical protein ACE5GV_01755 [Candidatus Scalindua sp.]
MMIQKISCVFILGSLSIIFCIKDSFCGDYQQVAGLIDLRTTYSDGAHDLDFLVKLAKKRGFDVLFINDHDRMTLEYGLFPFRNILRKKVEKPSVNSRGADKYLQNIAEISRKYPDMIVIPGSESAPFYYWAGSYFKGDLTAHNWERHLLVIGMENPEDYRNLPVLHNGFSTRYLRQLLPGSIIFLIPLFLGIVLIIRNNYRITGIVILVFSSFMLIEYHPFKSSPFDQYHGDQGYLPYQELIDYVRNRGGATFWTHPEASAGANVRKGPIMVSTPPHPEALLMTEGYTGFGSLYGTWIKTTEPGKEWDRVLFDYCRGNRDTPTWGISTADFHKEGMGGEKLGNFPTVFLVKEKTREEIILALKQGRMYACRSGNNFQRFVLKDFSIFGSNTNKQAVMGETIELKNNPEIRIRVSSSGRGDHNVDVRIIRSGKLIKTLSKTTPFVVDFKDDYFNPGELIYYRLDIPGKLVSNPIFVKFSRE